MIYLFLHGTHLNTVIVEADSEKQAIQKLAAYEDVSIQAAEEDWDLRKTSSGVLEYE
jgi:hypothetical protein